MPVAEQVAEIYCGVNGLLERVPLDKVAEFEKQFVQLLQTSYQAELKTIAEGKLTDEVTAKITEAANQIAGQF